MPRALCCAVVFLPFSVRALRCNCLISFELFRSVRLHNTFGFLILSHFDSLSTSPSFFSAALASVSAINSYRKLTSATCQVAFCSKSHNSTSAAYFVICTVLLPSFSCRLIWEARQLFLMDLRLIKNESSRVSGRIFTNIFFFHSQSRSSVDSSVCCYCFLFSSMLPAF